MSRDEIQICKQLLVFSVFSRKVSSKQLKNVKNLLKAHLIFDNSQIP